jgi:hypothetical protein
MASAAAITAVTTMAVGVAVTTVAVTTVVAAGIADGELERLNIQQRIILPALHPENTTPSPEDPDPGRHPHGTSRR